MAYYSVGFAPASAHQNVKKVWDKLLHEQVQNKLAFKGLIGTDKGGEGSLDSSVANKPIVQKTQLGKESGDQITMGLVKQLNGGATWYNTGKSGNTQLVDAEQTLTFHNTKVRIGHYRDAVAINGKMTLQRTPYDLLSVAKDLLSTKLASHLDKSTFFAYYAGFSPNIFREYGHATAVPANHPNRIFGKGQADLVSVGATDKMDAELIEYLRAWVVTENINPINIDGSQYWCLFIHPNGGKQLRADSLWQDANMHGMERGSENPLFQNALGTWAGIVVKESNNVETAKNFAGLTVSADAITLAADTVTGTATDFRMNLLLGANSLARAYGMESYMATRKEDDYGNISAFGGGMIYGDKRADWALSQDSGSDGATVNQSSAVVYTMSPGLNLPTTW